MTEKERFVINIQLKKLGLTASDIITVMKAFHEKNKEYNVIIEDINRLIKCFVDDRDYDKDSFCAILKNPRMYNLREDRISKMEKIFLENQYTQEEIKHIIGNYPSVLEQGPNSLNQKLRFYNDVQLKEAILVKPKRLEQDLATAYAKYRFLTDKTNCKDIKKEVFRSARSFYERYGITTTKLVAAFPLPIEYMRSTKANPISMTSKEKLVLTIIFRKFGINAADVKKIIAKFEDRRITYNVIIQALPKLQDYFIGQRGFDKETFGKVVRTVRIFNTSIDKIKSIEKTLADNEYTEEEVKAIETVNPAVVCHEQDSLDRKLRFYNNIKVKNLIINNPCNLWQGLKVSYARHQYFVAKNYSEEHLNNLFVSEEKFIDRYGIDNKVLLKTYPLRPSAFDDSKK